MSRFNLCSECGHSNGHHATGCPETPDDESPLVCRCCGMDETEVKGAFTVERAGPICQECAPVPAKEEGAT